MVLQLDNQLRHKTIPIFIFYFTIPFIFGNTLSFLLQFFFFFFLIDYKTSFFFLAVQNWPGKKKKAPNSTKNDFPCFPFPVNSFNHKSTQEQKKKRAACEMRNQSQTKRKKKQRNGVTEQ